MKLSLPAKILGVLLFVHFVVVAESTFYCRAPYRPSYGKHDGGWRTIFSIGSSVRFSCYTGYTLNGYSKLTCVLTRSGPKWSHYSPRCYRKTGDGDDGEDSSSDSSSSSSDSSSSSVTSCPKPPSLQNGRIFGSSYRVGAYIKYVCNSGFIRSGFKFRKCLSSGRWSGSAPTCKGSLCPYLRVPRNGKIKYTKGRNVGDKVWYFCRYGYSLVGQESRTCLNSLSWSGSSPFCSFGCGKPSRPNNGSVSFKKTTPGSVARYSCNNGFFLLGAKIRICQRSGKWSPSVPICKPRATCPSLNAPANGGIRFSNGLSVGSTATHFCQSGFVLKGNKNRVCGSKGAWTGSPPTCIRVSCPRLSIPRYGWIKFTNGVNIGSTASYTCLFGFILSGDKTRVCQSNGVWSGEDPICKRPVFCPRLTVPRNGWIKFTKGRLEGSKASYFCRSGFILVGDRTRVCGSNGEWSGSTPQCQQPTCPILKIPTYGVLKLSNGLNVGSVATYSCKPGFSLVGNEMRKCQSNRKWSGSEPTCKADMCDVLFDIKNGRVELEGTFVGATATYSCVKGYILVGNRQRTCQNSGIWTGSKPSCRIADCGNLPNPNNGKVVFTPSGSTTFEARATYSCNSGYTLKGDKTRDCQADETWSGSEPKCIPNMCEELFDIQNGRIELEGTFVGATATYSCVNGYVLVGNTQRTCQNNGIWTGSEPSCRIADCGPLPSPSNGEVSFQPDDTTIFGSRAIYSCDVGFSLKGNKVRVCQADGSWSGSAPTCVPNMCDELFDIDDGRVELEGTFVGATATYSCVNGYILVGNRRRTCQNNGKWTGMEPSCRIANCGPLSTPDNGEISFEPAGSTIFGTRATYSCNTGYSLEGGDATRVCQADETWSGSAPTCVANMCEVLPDISKGEVTLSGTSVGATATYSCVDGYILVGNERRICQDNGKWTGSEPSCRIANCGSLLKPSNGQIRFEPDGTTVFQSRAIYSCDPDYSLEGQRIRICQADETWSGSAPKCVRILCDFLPSINNGRVELEGRFVGATATYSCVNGYILEGNEQRTCQDSGKWTGSEPSCRIANCGSLPNPSNGQVTFRPDGTTVFGSIAMYSCNSGFSLQGQKTRECLADETWSGSAPKCVPVMCEVLSDIEKGAVTLEGRFVGATATYSCVDGYILEGNEQRTCQNSGIWTGSEPSCRIANCGSLPNPSNGEVTFEPEGTTVFGTRATYSCNPGFTLEGTKTRICQADETWSGSAPKCVPNMCEELFDIQNGRIELEGTFVGATATYSCVNGYILVGNRRRTCQNNGRWTGREPSCRVADCGSLSNPSNGQVRFEPVGTTVFGTRAIYSCDLGYSLEGADTRVCQANETWSGSAPKCRPVMCAALPNITNGRVVLNGRFVGATANYSCREGYILVGVRRRTCQNSGAWTGNEPSCRIANCGPLSAPEDGQISFEPADSTIFGTRATYSCNTGFSLEEGDEIRVCQADETWSGSAPTCVPNMCDELFDISNGRVDLEGTFVGATATYSCVEGYILVGNEQRTCQSNSKWTGSEPSCRIANCGSLPNPSNGQVRFEPDGTTVFQSRAIYSCNSGYSLDGADTRICQADETWSGFAPTCRPVMCENLPNISKGGVSLEGTFVGATATYSCVEGYILVGVRRRTCQSNGKWTSTEPSCRIADCGSLPNPSNGQVRFEPVGTTVFRTRAIYTCNPGYTLEGGMTRVCQGDETWSGSAPTCAPVMCDSLPAIANGGVSLEGRFVGATATYSCVNGYILVGNRQRTCQDSGKWTGSEPFCRIADCESLPNPTNGQVRFEPVGTTVFGSRAIYSCDSGFTLQGDETRDCQADETWSGSEPTCEPNMCDELLDIADGRVDLEGTFVGATATYSCVEGYILVGNRQRTCQNNGEWTGSEPFCRVANCGSLLAPTDGQIGFSPADTTTFGAIAIYTCDDGFSLLGNGTRVCQANETWSGSAPTCQPNMCDVLPDIADGRLERDGTFVGARTTYICNVGYILVGNEIRVCQINGQWTGTEPSCRIADCGSLPNPTNGQVRFEPVGTTVFGTRAIYSCDSGFTLQGDETRDCQADETWSGSAPTCEPTIMCPTLPNPSNGAVVLTDRTPGSLAQYSCGIGFNLVGRDTRLCQSNGTWNGTEPVCAPVDCGTLTDPENGIVFLQNTTLGSPAQYFCNRGFNLIGTDVRFCLETGLWSDEAPTCKPIRCPVLTNPANGTVSFNDTILNSRAVYSCNEGFALIGGRIRICLTTGFWSGIEPKCRPQVPGCGDPGTPVNGRRIGSNFSVDAVVFFRCNDDFDLVGSKFRVCQPDGLWSGVQPVCNPFNDTCTVGRDHYDRCMRRCDCKNGKFVDCCRIRKDYTGLSSSERRNYIDTLLAVVNDPVYGPRYISLIDSYTKSFNNLITHSTTPSKSQFFMYNRYFLQEFEDLLKDFDCTITIPYYDWTPFPVAPYTAAVWSNTDGFGDTARLSDRCVSTGPVRVGQYSLTPLSGGGCLTRDYRNQRFPDRDMINRDLLPVPISEFEFFHRQLHLFIGINIRCYIGGAMCSSNAANDPVYFLHVAQLDSIFTRWQDLGAGRESVRYGSDTSNLLGTPFAVNRFLKNMALPYGTCVKYDFPAIHDTSARAAFSAAMSKSSISTSNSKKLDCNPMNILLQATRLTPADNAHLMAKCNY